MRGFHKCCDCLYRKPSKWMPFLGIPPQGPTRYNTPLPLSTKVAEVKSASYLRVTPCQSELHLTFSFTKEADRRPSIGFGLTTAFLFWTISLYHLCGERRILSVDICIATSETISFGSLVVPANLVELATRSLVKLVYSRSPISDALRSQNSAISTSLMLSPSGLCVVHSIVTWL
jgi:hypothetical protein